jgi:putative membrane protein
MKTALALAGLAVMLASPVFAQSAAEKTGASSVMGVAPKTEDFVTEAASSDMFEIESGKLAIERYSDAATKTFAQHMITDHTKTSEELKALVSGGEVKATIPAAMSSSQQSMLDELKKLNGDDFAKQYHSDQEDVHEDRRPVQALWGRRRECGPQGLGRKDPTGAGTSSDDGERHEQVSLSKVRGGSATHLREAHVLYTR